jgi:polyferredoxin
MPCGWLCPFGLLQEALYKIRSKKIPIPKFMSYGRYVVLVLFVFLLPLLVLDQYGFGQTWFCKWICPAGTLEAGIPLVILNEGIRSQVGLLFSWKMFVLILFLVWMIFSQRPFCRTTCPVDLKIYESSNSPDCVRCLKCVNSCQYGAIDYEFFPKKQPKKNTVQQS